MTKPVQTPFQKWYAQNRASLAEKRAERYRNDPEYRKRISDYRAKKTQEKQAELRAKGCSLSEACEALGITDWTMNRWKNAGYLPVQSLRGCRFNDHKLQLLGLLKQFFDEHPKRLMSIHQDKLNALVQVIHHNWDN